MKRIVVVSKDRSAREYVKKEAKKYEFTYATKNPDVVITYGGDGTFLHAEREYPGVPKLLVRHSKRCHKCHDDPLDHTIDFLSKGKYKPERWLKLEAQIKGRKLLCVNDFILRNQNLAHAIRLEIRVNKKIISDEFIGDGVVVSTPFGSTAYYQSITKQSFRKGIGVALNNGTGDERTVSFKESDTLSIKILRGPADFAADNERWRGTLQDGDVVRIRAAAECATILR